MKEQLKFWRNRLKKFLRKYLYYNRIGDSYISYYKDVTFLSYDETVERLLKDNVSIVRFGDEVFDMLLGIGLYFNDWRQRYDRKLAARTKEVLRSTDPRLLVCFNPELILKTKAEFEAEGIGWQHHFWTHSRIYLKNYLNKGQTYGRALSFHARYNTTLPYDRLIDHLKTKHLIVVTTNTARFNNAQLGLTTDYVEAPKSDAFDMYDELLATVRGVAGKYDMDKVLVMASIGPTAKVMIYDLVHDGYTAWDTGQFFDLALERLKVQS
jgi:Glycosyltransferase GT-D fold